jgi:KipI family sensor histidine kinase inhibitor
VTRFLPVGDAALALELGDRIDPDLAARVRGLDAALRERPFPGLVECVPTQRSLLVLFDPQRTQPSAVSQALRERLAHPGRLPAPRHHVVPVAYGGAHGIDLETVAASLGLASDAVVTRHLASEYAVQMLGFAPGFAYLGPLDPGLELPRRATPRERVPAGSVAIAARQTAIYPGASAGGWHLIGRTSATLFDPAADPPALLAPGDRVRFVAAGALGRDAPEPSPPRAARPALEVIEPGLLTTVQDAGRFGFRRYGVSGSGAADRGALARANAALGNAPGEAALECTLSGPSLRFLEPAWFAIAGADLGASLERGDLGAWAMPLGTPVRARRGNVLRFAGPRHGCRAIVAFAGGIDVPLVLGSRSTDRLGAFGGFAGRPLRAGDVLGLGAPREVAGQAVPEPPLEADELVVRAVPGPQDDHFDPTALARLAATAWEVLPGSDRAALRLAGPRLAHAGPGEIASDGMLPGCIQVPPDGQPILMLRDAPTTGGYPKIATVVVADLDRLAQLVPGRGRVRVRFA